MILLTLFVVLIFSIGSVSSQSLDDIDNESNVKEIKVLKSNEISNAGSTTKVKSNMTKVTNTSKTTKTDNKTSNKTNKANTTTVNKKTLAKTSTNFMNSVEKNGKFPKVKISNKNYSDTEYLYLISKAVENDSNSKIEIRGNLVKPYNNTKIKSVKGSINKTEYVKIAGKTRKFIDENHRAPNWASSSKGNIPYNQLILMFSKCLDTYNKTNKLPNSVKLDDLDLDVIKNKLNKKAASNSSKKTTTSTKKTNSTKTSTAKKTNTTKTSNKTSTKKTNSTKTSTNKVNNTKTSTGKVNNTKTTNPEVNTVGKNVDENLSLVEKSMNYINNILNNILDKLDPSKYKIDVTNTDEANVKVNTSKVSVDVSGKSTVNVKISSNAKKTITTKKTSTAKTTTSKKTNTTKANSTKKTTTTKKTNSTKTSSSTKKTTTTKKTNSTKTSSTTKKTNTTSKKTNSKTVSKISDALKKYLSSSTNCQVSNKKIQELAKSLTSSLKTEKGKAKKIFNWVRDNIQYEKYGNTRKGAVKTLKKMRGNCVDQSHLLIALSRAAGIPARYVNGGNCRFLSGYVTGHVWTQMYVNKKWVVADPTSSRNTLGNIRNWNTKNYVHYGEYSSISF